MSTNQADVRAFNQALGRELRAQRARRGMGQSDLVDDDAGMSLSTVQRIERGLGAKTPQLISLASTFGMSLSGFIAAVEAEQQRAKGDPAKGEETAPRPRIPFAGEVADLELQLRLEAEDAGDRHAEVKGE